MNYFENYILDLIFMKGTNNALNGTELLNQHLNIRNKIWETNKFICKKKLQPSITIIIPHHNIPELLVRCLCSIPIRPDIQVIIVDDCSDENVFSMSSINCKECGVEIYKTKINSGGGAARNIGLKHSKGDWLLFIDADDFFNPCFEKLINMYKDCQSDIIYFKCSSQDNETYNNTVRGTVVNNAIDSFNINPQLAEKQLRFEFGEPWCKMIKREVVENNNIKFDETSIHNDTTFSYLVGFYANKIEVSKYALCTITYRQNSVSLVINNEKRLERLTVFGKSSYFFQTNKIHVKEKRHWEELAYFRIKNKDFFQKGYNILINIGHKRSKIMIGVAKEIYSYYKAAIIWRIKHRSLHYYYNFG